MRESALQILPFVLYLYIDVGVKRYFTPDTYRRKQNGLGEAQR